MKDSDINELYAESNIDPTIISDLKHIQQRLIELTRNNEPMMRDIIEDSLLLEKNPDHSYDDSSIVETIEEIFFRMRRRDETNEVKTARANAKEEVFTIVLNLGLIITGYDKRIADSLKHLPDETTLFYKKLIREKIEEKVNEIFYPGDIEGYEMVVDEIQETSMIGDIETQFDNMEV